MQYRFALNFGTLSTMIIILYTLRCSSDCNPACTNGVCLKSRPESQVGIFLERLVRQNVCIVGRSSICPFARPYLTMFGRMFVSSSISPLVRMSVIPSIQINYRLRFSTNLTVCPRSSDPFYILIYYITWVTISWTHSTSSISKRCDQNFRFMFRIRNKY